MRLWRGALAAAVTAAMLATAGCSGGSSNETATSAMLRADVLALTRHAAAGDTVAARAALDALSQDIAAAAAAGQITPTLAQQLRRDIAAVSADLHPTTTTPTARRTSAKPSARRTTTSAKAKPAPAPPKPPGHVKHGHGHGGNKDG